MKKYTLYDIQYSEMLRDTMRGRSFFNIHVLRDLQGRQSKDLYFDKILSGDNLVTLPILCKLVLMS